MKIIGIPGYKKYDHFGISLSYINFISKFGIPLIITPDHVSSIPKVDMLYLPGGLDVNPLQYGDKPSYYTQNPNVLLEWFDHKILPYYISNKTPIFSVCRSAQQLWGLFGGEINQHNDTHAQSTKYSAELVHSLHFEKKYENLSKTISLVNSRHHQTMNAKNNIPSSIDVIAYAKEEISKNHSEYFLDIVEIWKHQTLPIVGCQFHPEDHSEYNDKFSPFVINCLMNGLEIN